jgi:hypothetical protein
VVEECVNEFGLVNPVFINGGRVRVIVFLVNCAGVLLKFMEQSVLRLMRCWAGKPAARRLVRFAGTEGPKERPVKAKSHAHQR